MADLNFNTNSWKFDDMGSTVKGFDKSLLGPDGKLTTKGEQVVTAFNLAVEADIEDADIQFVDTDNDGDYDAIALDWGAGKLVLGETDKDTSIDALYIGNDGTVIDGGGIFNASNATGDGMDKLLNAFGISDSTITTSKAATVNKVNGKITGTGFQSKDVAVPTDTDTNTPHTTHPSETKKPATISTQQALSDAKGTKTDAKDYSAKDPMPAQSNDGTNAVSVPEKPVAQEITVTISGTTLYGPTGADATVTYNLEAIKSSNVAISIVEAGGGPAVFKSLMEAGAEYLKAENGQYANLAANLLSELMTLANTEDDTEAAADGSATKQLESCLEDLQDADQDVQAAVLTQLANNYQANLESEADNKATNAVIGKIIGSYDDNVDGLNTLLGKFNTDDADGVTVNTKLNQIFNAVIAYEVTDKLTTFPLSNLLMQACPTDISKMVGMNGATLVKDCLALPQYVQDATILAMINGSKTPQDSINAVTEYLNEKNPTDDPNPLDVSTIERFINIYNGINSDSSGTPDKSALKDAIIGAIGKLGTEAYDKLGSIEPPVTAQDIADNFTDAQIATYMNTPVEGSIIKDYNGPFINTDLKNSLSSFIANNSERTAAVINEGLNLWDSAMLLNKYLTENETIDTALFNKLTKDAVTNILTHVDFAACYENPDFARTMDALMATLPGNNLSDGTMSWSEIAEVINHHIAKETGADTFANNFIEYAAGTYDGKKVGGLIGGGLDANLSANLLDKAASRDGIENQDQFIENALRGMGPETACRLIANISNGTYQAHSTTLSTFMNSIPGFNFGTDTSANYMSWGTLAKAINTGNSNDNYEMANAFLSKADVSTIAGLIIGENGDAEAIPLREDIAAYAIYQLNSNQYMTLILGTEEDPKVTGIGAKKLAEIIDGMTDVDIAASLQQKIATQKPEIVPLLINNRLSAGKIGQLLDAMSADDIQTHIVENGSIDLSALVSSLADSIASGSHTKFVDAMISGGKGETLVEGLKDKIQGMYTSNSPEGLAKKLLNNASIDQLTELGTTALTEAGVTTENQAFVTEIVVQLYTRGVENAGKFIGDNWDNLNTEVDGNNHWFTDMVVLAFAGEENNYMDLINICGAITIPDNAQFKDAATYMLNSLMADPEKLQNIAGSMTEAMAASTTAIGAEGSLLGDFQVKAFDYFAKMSDEEKMANTSWSEDDLLKNTIKAAANLDEALDDPAIVNTVAEAILDFKSVNVTHPSKDWSNNFSIIMGIAARPNDNGLGGGLAESEAIFDWLDQKNGFNGGTNRELMNDMFSQFDFKGITNGKTLFSGNKINMLGIKAGELGSYLSIIGANDDISDIISEIYKTNPEDRPETNANKTTEEVTEEVTEEDTAAETE